jgi:hypothetical protein
MDNVFENAVTCCELSHAGQRCPADDGPEVALINRERFLSAEQEYANCNAAREAFKIAFWRCRDLQITKGSL